MRKVWVPWVDAFQPFYIAEDTFASSLLDIYQIGAKHAMLHPFPHTLGRASHHLKLWLPPFLAWHPLLHEYRRNFGGRDILTDMLSLGSNDI